MITFVCLSVCLSGRRRYQDISKSLWRISIKFGRVTNSSQGKVKFDTQQNRSKFKVTEPENPLNIVTKITKKVINQFQWNLAELCKMESARLSLIFIEYGQRSRSQGQMFSCFQHKVTAAIKKIHADCTNISTKDEENVKNIFCNFFWWSLSSRCAF